MKYEPLTTPEAVEQAFKDGRKVEFRAAFGRSVGRWVDVSRLREDARADLLKVGQVRAVNP